MRASRPKLKWSDPTGLSNSRQTCPNTDKTLALKAKVALITGGARIGKTVAQALAERGCALARTYRGSRDAAETTAAAARAVGVQATVLLTDATDPAQVEAAVRQTASLLGRLDILPTARPGRGSLPAA